MNIQDGSSAFKVRDQREQALNKTIIDIIYPIGTIYVTENASFNPNTTWGGKWVQTAVNRVLQGTNSTSNVGKTVEAGLPNITGKMENVGQGRYDRVPLLAARDNKQNISINTTGSLTGTEVSSYHYFRVEGTDESWYAPILVAINFNASKSNPIYGRSSTVQPPAEYVFMWKRIA